MSLLDVMAKTCGLCLQIKSVVSERVVSEPVSIPGSPVRHSSRDSVDTLNDDDLGNAQPSIKPNHLNFFWRHLVLLVFIKTYEYPYICKDICNIAYVSM